MRLHSVRSRSLILLVVVAICFFVFVVRFNRRDVRPQTPTIQTILVLSESSTTKSTVQQTETTKSIVTTEISSFVEKNLFAFYSSTEHLLSLLRQQANDEKQVIVTIIGGDSYSIFAWDWYERMLEISGNSSRCHCFVVAMDEIAVVMSVKRGIPVFYSTYTFEEQIQSINSIEARQHSLYRVGHGKFSSAAKIAQLGYSVLLSEMDVFWRANPFKFLKTPVENFDLQISDHFGSHPRINIGIFFVRSSNSSIRFFSYVADFWLRFGKGGFLSDQRVLDALLKNYDRLDKTYLRAVSPIPSINWTTHVFGGHFSHLMTDGSAFILFDQAAKVHLRSKKFYGNDSTKYLTVTVDNINMPINYRNLLVRALLIIHQTIFPNRTLIFPAFAANLTRISLQSQLDIKKFLLYWSDERVRLPTFLLLARATPIPVTTVSFSPKETHENVNGILDLKIDSIPLDLPAPSAQFEVFVRDSLLWCSPPIESGNGWCVHHPRDFAATMEILFACRGDPYPPCANKTERNEQFLNRPYEKDK